PPPEWAENAGEWPAHNYDISNTRATTQTPINSQTVSRLKVKWRFTFKGASLFGVFSSSPIVLNGTVYLQDLKSNVYALDRSTGTPKWKFSTVQDGAKLWGDPKVNSGGGLWYPPSVDSQGRVFLSVANPAPLYGTPKFPNGSSRPGPDLYTDSLVALDGQTGKLLWFRQVIPHDLRDYDLQVDAITATVPIKGVQTEVELVAGKMGKVYAYRA